jgi:hypothetical protein
MKKIIKEKYHFFRLIVYNRILLKIRLIKVRGGKIIVGMRR